MKAVVMQSNFAHVLSLVSRIVSARSTLPVLGNILIDISGGKLIISSTDLEIAMSAETTGKVLSDGKITIPARLLIDFVTENSDQNITITLNDLTLNLKSNHYEANIKGIVAEEFPTIPKAPKEKFCAIKSDDLKDALKKVSMACATDDTRPVLAGVYIKFDGKNITFVATDSYRLAEKKIEQNIELEKKEIIVPSRAINELLRLLSNEKSEKVDIILDENQIFFLIGNVQIVSRLIDGAFPPYEQIIPKEAKILVKTTLIEMISAIKMSAIFARDIANNIKFKVSKDTLTISSIAKEVGDTHSEVKATVTGGEVLVAFNARYLLDVLTILPGDEVIMSFNDDSSAVMIKTNNDDSYTYLVMPLKTE